MTWHTWTPNNAFLFFLSFFFCVCKVTFQACKHSVIKYRSFQLYCLPSSSLLLHRCALVIIFLMCISFHLSRCFLWFFFLLLFLHLILLMYCRTLAAIFCLQVCLASPPTTGLVCKFNLWACYCLFHITTTDSKIRFNTDLCSTFWEPTNLPLLSILLLISQLHLQAFYQYSGHRVVLRCWVHNHLYNDNCGRGIGPWANAVRLMIAVCWCISINQDVPQGIKQKLQPPRYWKIPTYVNLLGAVQ